MSGVPYFSKLPFAQAPEQFGDGGAVLPMFVLYIVAAGEQGVPPAKLLLGVRGPREIRRLTNRTMVLNSKQCKETCGSEHDKILFWIW
jgi:hypothetical protein